MSFFACNIRVLRQAKGRVYSVQRVADDLELKRSRLSSYENGTAEPSMEVLLRIAKYYRVSLDRLLLQDMRKTSQYELGTIQRGYDHRVLKDMMNIDLTTS
jgi:transcriptional regulator with XRE-family HTH domain